MDNEKITSIVPIDCVSFILQKLYYITKTVYFFFKLRHSIFNFEHNKNNNLNYYFCNIITIQQEHSH
jgi:hypothetical protein